MIGRTFLSSAALSLASQLGGLRQAAGEPSAAAQPPSGTTDDASALGLVGRTLADTGSAILQRELRYGAVPELERSLKAFASATPVATMTPAEAVDRWNGLSLGEGLWVDIGSGNGDSLGRLARRHPSGRFIGVDKENSEALFFEMELGAKHVENLPENVRYLVLSYNRPGSCMIRHDRLKQIPLKPWMDRPSDPDMAMDATVESIGRESASVVSLIFPYSESRRRSLVGRVIHGPKPDILDCQLATAVCLLRPGGMGVAVLESSSSAEELHVLERAVRSLKTRPELRWIGFTPQGFGVEALGLAPYAPRNEAGESVDTLPLREGKAVFFLKKS